MSQQLGHADLETTVPSYGHVDQLAHHEMVEARSSLATAA